MLSESDRIRLQERLALQLGKREPLPLRFEALIGDGTGGDPRVPDKPNYVYVRRIGRGVIEECLNTRVAARNDLPVIVGFSHEMPHTLQVLAGKWERISELGSYAYTAPHHQSHEHLNEYGGDDVVWVQGQQIVPLLAIPRNPEDMYLTVYAGMYPWGSSWHWFEEATSPDFTASVPGIAGQARYTLLSIDGATETLQLTDGAIFAEALPPPEFEDMIPACPTGAVPIAAVALVSTTTSIGWDILWDCRMFAGASGGSLTPAPHSLLDVVVHDDTDTQAPTQGSLIVGNATPAWTELVIGGVRFLLVVNAGGTDPEWIAFDWDLMAAAAGADMVHDHSAAGEGGEVPLTSLGSYTQGDLIYGGAADWQDLAIGNIGDVLQVNAAGTEPEWEAPSNVGRWEPLTDGDTVNPELVFMAGDVIMVWIP